MKISVALAAYNGEKYIGEQIESILPQLGRDDEIVVSDDNPAGKTRAAVEFYSAYMSRARARAYAEILKTLFSTVRGMSSSCAIRTMSGSRTRLSAS